MTNHNIWQNYLRTLLTQNGQFKLIETTQKNQTLLECYQQQLYDTETQIKMCYHVRDGRLITLDITNPKTPGHNAEQIGYFDENDFDESNKIGFVKIGLLFNDVNVNAIEKILKSGLNGTESKYFVSDKLQFSKVSKRLGDNEELYTWTHYFSYKNFWIRLLKKIINPKQDYVIEKIELRDIFSGVK